MRNEYSVIIRIQEEDVFYQAVDAPDAKSALEKAVKVAMERDMSHIKSNLERRWDR